jgi:hypothetical protein
VQQSTARLAAGDGPDDQKGLRPRRDHVHLHDFQTRMDEKPGRETKGGLARDFPDLSEGNEFGRHVAVCEVTPLAFEETLRLSVLGLVRGVIAKQSGGIEEHYLLSDAR